MISFMLFQVHASANDKVPDFQGSSICQSCHEGAYQDWQSSHHALAWLPVDDENVDGDFNNSTFEHRGRKTRFFKDGDRYFIETSDILGGNKVLEVKGVAGITPLQQYLIETEPGRLQSLDIAWDQENERWYHLYPDQVLAPNDGYHWSGPYKNWNSRCAECHATGFQKNYDPRTRRYSSTQSEIGVGCEACHGPGEAHVAWANGASSSELSVFEGTDDQGLSVNFKDAFAHTEIEQCAACHSRREPNQDGNPLPGTPFHDSYRLALLRDGLYHADGQIRDEVYVYGSFLQSKMYAEGVRCSDCHEPHSGQLKAEGNGVCTQCHSEAGNNKFSSLTLKRYDSSDHHFHETGTAGAQCVSCHMIERTYMGIDGRRDHSFRVPRPDLSASLGTPNACTDCHTDKPASWAAEELKARFPDSAHRSPHFASVFALARGGVTGLGEQLLNIARQETLPGIVRASAINLYAQHSGREAHSDVFSLLNDTDPLVRAAAVSLTASQPASTQVQLLSKLLEDPLKSVRIAAARQLLGASIGVGDQRTQRAAQNANDEWRAALSSKLDYPETHMVIAGTALTLRNPNAAIRAFQEATQLDPQLADAWIMQIRLFMALQDYTNAQMTLQRAKKLIPDDTRLADFERLFQGR